MEKISGVYQIQSLIYPNKSYIGSAVNLYKRKSIHLRSLRRNKHYSRLLQRHYNKYGEDDLVFEIIESGDYICKEHLLSREQGWLYHFRYKNKNIPYFNTCEIAGSTLGVKGQIPWNKGKKGIYSEETIELMKLNNGMRGRLPIGSFKKGDIPWNKGLSKETDERVANYVDKVSNANKGHIPWNKGLTKETDQRIKKSAEKSSVTKKGCEPWNKGKVNVYSSETLEKMSNASQGRTPWNKGLVGVCEAWNKGFVGYNEGGYHTEETKRKISLAQKGIPESDEFKENLSKTMLEFYKTEKGRETIEKAKLTKLKKKNIHG